MTYQTFPPKNKLSAAKGTVPFSSTNADHLSMVPGQCPRKLGQSPQFQGVMMGLSPSALVETVLAAQRGNREAFGRLAVRFERVVYATVLRRVGNHAEAEELCQDVFIQTLRKLEQLEEPQRFGGWLRKIADRMAINRAVRRAPRTLATAGQCENSGVEYRTPLTVILAREQARQVRTGLRKLRALDRQTLEAFYFEGRSLREMSRKFDTPVGTIKRRLHVARKRLAKELAAV
jgi:RNA polymerase sigma-70 factor (ECF subfamily)